MYVYVCTFIRAWWDTRRSQEKRKIPTPQSAIYIDKDVCIQMDK